jgi:hypothetical protein
MKHYLSVGIGDMICLDSILTQEERDNISEIYWACRFGKYLVPLMDANPSYPNLVLQHVISDTAGRQTMKAIDPVAENFWHFRPDYDFNYFMGLALFGLESHEVYPINTAGIIMDTNRKYQGSSFIDAAKPYLGFSYILFHYPTSTRPRTDIATITEDDWHFIENLSKKENLPVVVLADHDIVPPLSNCIVMVNPEIHKVVSLAKYCSYYAGCDSFGSILASKVLPKERLYIKSHNGNIRVDVLSSVWLQKFFLPHPPEDISEFYKNYIGNP